MENGSFQFIAQPYKMPVFASVGATLLHIIRCLPDCYQHTAVARLFVMQQGQPERPREQDAWDRPAAENDSPRAVARLPYASREASLPCFFTRKWPSLLGPIPEGNNREVSRALIERSRKLINQSRRLILKTKNSLLYHHTHPSRQN